MFGLYAFIMVCVLGVIFFGAVLTEQGKRKRRAALAMWAHSRRLAFHPAKVRNFDLRYPGLACLQQGSNRYANNIVSGQYKRYHMTAFDFHYETKDSDGDTINHSFSAVILNPPFPVRPLLIRREGFFDKIKAGFGYDDINFESAEFSKEFYVTALDKRWAYDVIHPRTMDRLLKSFRNYTVECDYGVMCVFVDHELDAFGFERAYQHGAGILDGVPEYAKKAR